MNKYIDYYWYFNAQTVSVFKKNELDLKIVGQIALDTKCYFKREEPK